MLFPLGPAQAIEASLKMLQSYLLVGRNLHSPRTSSLSTVMFSSDLVKKWDQSAISVTYLLTLPCSETLGILYSAAACPHNILCSLISYMACFRLSSLYLPLYLTGLPVTSFFFGLLGEKPFPLPGTWTFLALTIVQIRY